MNKKSELNIMVNDSDPHIIGITEYWANKDIVTGHKTVTMGVVYRCPNITKESNEKIQNAIR